MSDFTMDVENKLEKAYAAVNGNAAKKYGFEKIGARNAIEYLEDNRTDNRELIKM